MKAENNTDMITVFELQMHGSTVTDTLKSNLLRMIEVEIENLERDEFDELEITIVKKQMSQTDYENLHEFEGY